MDSNRGWQRKKTLHYFLNFSDSCRGSGVWTLGRNIFSDCRDHTRNSGTGSSRIDNRSESGVVSHGQTRHISPICSHRTGYWYLRNRVDQRKKNQEYAHLPRHKPTETAVAHLSMAGCSLDSEPYSCVIIVVQIVAQMGQEDQMPEDWRDRKGEQP
ncbi:hypothetical protein C8R44DRAFT_753385 [Mycena epipterygia]|nr:hypothetical protein C8R44DRAFT_753385 [Mycena epipterygia]